MRKLCRSLAAALAGLLLASGSAAAHPHVWVTIKSELVYAVDGSVTGVRHVWTFDEMFSAFASQGLDKDNDGTLTREELAELAEVNISSMKEYGYFTKARANGKTAEFAEPKEYFLAHKDKLLTLHFTLPFKAPVKTQNLDLEVYDGSFFVAFSLDEKDPVRLVNAPAACQLALARPNAASQTQSRSLGESFFNQLDASSSYGAQFANKISVKCP